MFYKTCQRESIQFYFCILFIVSNSKNENLKAYDRDTETKLSYILAAYKMMDCIHQEQGL